MKKLILIFFVLGIANYSGYSQTKIIKGRVISNQFETLIGVSIMFDGKVKVGKTDVEGFFQIEIPDSVKKVSFGGPGLELAIIELIDKCDEVEIVMLLAGTYDFMTLKQADRLRKKRFKKLPRFHKEAFEKHLFKTDKACYVQKFIPYLKRK